MGELDNLIKLLSEGDEKAFREVYELYHQKIFAVGFYLTSSRTVAQDITQDVFLKIWNLRQELTSVKNFDAWLRTLVKNHTYNILIKAARERRRARKEPYLALVSNFVDSTIEEKERLEIVEKAIANLPQQQKTAYILSRHERVKISDIAQMMNLSPHTVKNHLKAASASITTFLQKNIDIVVLAAFVYGEYKK